MANKIQQRRGLKANMPTGSAGELLYATDTRELFMGTGDGNVNMGGSHWYRGTAMSGTSTTSNAYSYSACPEVKLDDIYMNTSNGNIYACTTAGKGSAAKWTYQGCMKGPQGAKGETGTVDVDSTLSDTSTRPIQNKTVKNEFEVILTLISKAADKIIVTDTVSTTEYIPKKSPSDGSDIVSVLCYRASGLPIGSVCGILEADNADYNGNSGYITQYYKDFVSGKSYYRDLEGYYDDGQFCTVDGEQTFWEENTPWVEYTT